MLAVGVWYGCEEDVRCRRQHVFREGRLGVRMLVGLLWGRFLGMGRGISLRG